MTQTSISDQFQQRLSRYAPEKKIEVIILVHPLPGLEEKVAHFPNAILPSEKKL